MVKSMILLIMSALALGFASFLNTTVTEDNEEPVTKNLPDRTKEFKNYWFDGRGEVATYKLSQARYGEVHTGSAALIFVSEPFSKSKQVKLDNWQVKGDRQDILKMNFVKKFQTGVYPYSTMLSVFNKVDSDNRLVKLTSSVQEWCGQVFMQLNASGKELQYVGYSYFEAEGDHSRKLSKVWVEDELWNIIRITPERLPLGKQQVIPNTTFLRFNHHAMQIVEAEFDLDLVEDSKFGSKEVSKYTISYKQPEYRELSIYFETQFPHTILGWEDTYKDIAWNSERQLLTTTAVLDDVTRTDYWNKNKIQHMNTLFE